MPVYRRFAFPKPPKRHLRISFSDDVSQCGSTWCVETSKDELLKHVSEWLDAHGTHFNDYDTIDIKILKKKENVDGQ